MGEKNTAVNATSFFVSNLINAGLTFLTLVMLARLMAPSEYGVLTIYLAYISIITSIIGLSLDGSVAVNFFKQTKDELRLHVSSCLVIIVAVCVMCEVIVYSLLSVLMPWLKVTSGWLLMGVLCAGAQSVINIKMAIWIAKRQTFEYSLFQIVQSVALSLLTLYLTDMQNFGWEGRAWAFAVIVILLMIGLLWLMHRDGEVGKRVNIRSLRLALNFGLPLVPHVCGALLFSYVDRFLINGMLGPDFTGLYQLAAQIGLIVLIFTDALNKVFSPWLYRNLEISTLLSKRKIVYITYWYFAIATFISVIAFFIPWNLAVLLGGSNYKDAGPVVPYFIMGNCIGGMYFMVVNYIFYTGKTGLLSLATLISGFIGALAGYFAITNFGLIGAGCGFVVGKLTHFLLTWRISASLYPMPWVNRERFHNL